MEIVKTDKETWRIAVVCLIRRSFLLSKVFYCMVVT